nr:hypothetical protein [Tanacetum cinerariifolium]
MKVNAATHKLTTAGKDGKKIIITEASIRRDLRLDDTECTACLPNVAIFEELARMRAITPLFETMMVQPPKEVAEIEKLKKRVKKLEGKKKKRTYMNNMEGYKKKDFKGKSFDAIKKTFDKVYKRVNTFVAMDSEVMEGSKKTQAEVTNGCSKRAGDEIEQESAKRQKLEKEDDTAELKRCLEIVTKDDVDVTIEATPLSSKSPTIVDYKVYKKGRKITSKSSGRMETHKTIKLLEQCLRTSTEKT